MFLTSTSARDRVLNALVDHAPPSEVTFQAVTLDDEAGPLADDMAARDVEVTGVGAPGIRSVGTSAVRLGRLLRRQRPDLLHTNLFVPSFAAAIARATVPGAPPSILCRHHNTQHHVD